MAIVTDFRAHLLGLQEVNSFCGGNIYPVVNKKEGLTHFIVYTPRLGERDVWYKGGFGKAVLRIQIDIYSTSFSDNQTVYDAILNTFNGFSGTLNNNTYISRGEVHNHTELLDGVDVDFYRTTCEVYLTH